MEKAPQGAQGDGKKCCQARGRIARRFVDLPLAGFQVAAGEMHPRECKPVCPTLAHLGSMFVVAQLDPEVFGGCRFLSHRLVVVTSESCGLAWRKSHSERPSAPASVCLQSYQRVLSSDRRRVRLGGRCVGSDFRPFRAKIGDGMPQRVIVSSRTPSFPVRTIGAE